MRERAIITNFYVVGHRFTEFPLDMLRHGECYPATTDDANAIAANVTRMERSRDLPKEQRILLSTHLDPFGRGFLPSAQRWRSFGWEVEIKDAAGEWGPYLTAEGVGTPRLYHARALHADALVEAD